MHNGVDDRLAVGQGLWDFHDDLAYERGIRSSVIVDDCAYKEGREWTMTDRQMNP